MGLKNNWGSKRFWFQKDFGYKKVGVKNKKSDQNNCRSNEILGPNEFWVENFCGKKILGLNKCWVPKKFSLKK